MIRNTTLKFLKDLKVNNNRPWFEKHKDEYIAAKEDFEGFIQKLIDTISKFDPDIKSMEAKNCTFRQYRDVRFSKDKRPYKINMGAYMAKGGKKSMYGGYYFHLEPGKSLLGGGLWMPEASEVKKVRQEMDYSFDEFSAIINNKRFKKEYGDLYSNDNIKLKTVPKGYDATNPAIEHLKLKSFFAEKEIGDKEIISNSLLKDTASAFKDLKPLIDFLNRAIE
jgi:uncharacterized protein (TIGR02453 family)